MLDEAEREINEIESHFNKNKESADTQQQTIANLRKTPKVIDKIMNSLKWSELESQLKEAFYELERINVKYGNNKTTKKINQLGTQLKEITQTKHLKLGRIIFEEIQSFSSTIFTPVQHSVVENLLFHLTEEGMLSSSQLKKYFEQISALKVKPDETSLQSIYKHLKEYKNER